MCTKPFYPRFLMFAFLMLTLELLHAQVGINQDGSDPDSSAVLDVQSTDKGLLIPRMTSAERNAISSPANGLMVYDRTSSSFWYYDQSQWIEVLSGDTLIADAFIGDGSGLTNLPTMATWHLTGNAGTDTLTDFIGTTDNMPLDLRVNNHRGLRLLPVNGNVSLIGGFSGNSIDGGSVGAVVLGGSNGSPNQIIGGSTSTISGGLGNSITSSNGALISGGYNNTVSGSRGIVVGGENNLTSGDYGFVGGGFNNQSTALYSFVGGGFLNQAGGTNSAVLGGSTNQAMGTGSIVLGGAEAQAIGDFSLAFGIKAKALGEGSMVLADRLNYDFPSTNDNEFAVRATGGLRFVTGVDNTGNPTQIFHINEHGAVGMNTLTGPDSSAILDIESTTQGILVPRMTSGQRTNINKPAEGLFVYDTQTNSFWFYSQANWVELGQSTSTRLSDADGDTYVEMEQSPNDDRVRIIASDSSRFVLDASGWVSEGAFVQNYSGAIPDSGAGTRMMWVPHQSAFRVGTVLGNQWDVDSIGDYSAVVGGFDHVATGANTFIGGGEENIASAPYASVVGGERNTASELGAMVAGGSDNITSGFISFVGGGEQNIASAIGAFVGGGQENTASDSYSFVGGGERGTASGATAFVGGGLFNTASGYSSFVGGGQRNTASDFAAFVAGGFRNTASEDYSFVGGGQNNSAQGAQSFVGGGLENQASGTSSVVMGGEKHTASGNSSFIGGGINNTASGYTSIVAGGLNNEAIGDYSFVGGHSNIASGYNSFVGGGIGNQAYSYGETVFGTFAETYSPISATAFNNNDRLLVVGNGTSNTSRSNALTLLKNGNLGLGISNPLQKLDLDGNMRLTGSSRSIEFFLPIPDQLTIPPTTPRISSITVSMSNNPSSATAQSQSMGFNVSNNGPNSSDRVMTLRGDGHVGIGTTDPQASLHISSTTDASLTSNGILQMGNTNALNLVLDGNEILARDNGNTAPLFLQADGGDLILNRDAGRVGIGTDNPRAPLHVNGTSTISSFTGTSNGGAWMSVTSGAGTDELDWANSAGSTAVSIYASGSIVADGEGVFVGATVNWSDRRIKQIQGISDRTKDLKTLNEIEITDYRKIDGGKPEKKVIAQQVREVFPQAVSLREGVIPNIYEHIEAFQFDADQQSLLITTQSPHGLQMGDLVDYYTEKQKYMKQEVLEVISAHAFRVQAKVLPTQLFVFGKWVHDVHAVDYDALSMLNISATQEQQRRIEVLEQENAQLKAMLQQQQTNIEAIQAALGIQHASASEK